MRWRGWWWWSARLATTGWDTLLLAYELPYSVGPLEYLIRASGASVAEIEES
ncbi:MAG: hypothetical protein HY690_09340 [Chloroflexi bacterium]|nr:hypothetical protein [Chloroflexota bacterium]